MTMPRLPGVNHQNAIRALEKAGFWVVTMRRVEGFTLWLGHVGDLVDRRTIIETGILAVIDLALEESPAVLPRDLAYCRFPHVAWAMRGRSSGSRLTLFPQPPRTTAGSPPRILRMP
jgi:hypothetical protein